MKAILLRLQDTGHETLSCLVINGKTFYVLEPPWRNNKRNVSCIPAGVYKARFLLSSASGKYKPCFHITGVPGRSGILIHCGNVRAHTKGCLVIGLRRGTIKNQPAVLNSKSALRLLVNAANKRDFDLEVINGLAS